MCFSPHVLHPYAIGWPLEYKIVGLEDSLCLDKGTFSAKKKVKKNDAVKNRSLKFCDMIAWKWSLLSET